MDVVCKNCGFIYSDGIHMSGGRGSFSGNISECPECDTINKGIEGTFEFDHNGNIIREYIRDANLSQNEVIQLRALLQESLISPPTVALLQEQVAEINPNLSKLFNLTPLSNNDLWAFLALVISILTLGFTAATYYRDSEEAQPTIINNYYNSSIPPTPQFNNQRAKEKKEQQAKIDRQKKRKK